MQRLFANLRNQDTRIILLEKEHLFQFCFNVREYCRINLQGTDKFAEKKSSFHLKLIGKKTNLQCFLDESPLNQLFVPTTKNSCTWKPVFIYIYLYIHLSYPTYLLA